MYKECPKCGSPMSRHDDSKGTITYICSNRDCTYTETEKYNSKK